MKFRSAFAGATFAGAVLIATGASASTITLFSDQTAFETATGATTVENFTDAVHAPISSGILNSNTTDAGLKVGDILPGVTYSTPVGSGYFFNIDGGNGFAGGYLDTVGQRVLTVTFDAAQKGFGFDTDYVMGAFTVVINGTYIKNFDAVSSDKLAFFGFESGANDIKTVTISGNDNIFGFAIDNFTYNANAQVASVPGPIAGAGLPALLALGCAFFFTPRRKMVL